jgi:hypothetical protein
MASTLDMNLPLQSITVEFSDAADRPTFVGYTNGRHWNGWECPWFTLEIAEQMFAHINFRTRRATADEAPHGGLWVNESDDLPTDPPYLMKCQPVTTVDGVHKLMDCGGWLTFSGAE